MSEKRWTSKGWVQTKESKDAPKSEPTKAVAESKEKKESESGE